VPADLIEDVGLAGRLERRAAGQQGVQRGPQPINVTGDADPARVDHLLRCRVPERAQRAAAPGHRLRAVQALRQPEVGDGGATVGADQYVVRLEVAVQHPPLVRVLDGAGDGLDVSSRPPGRQGT
jgi:hypothetical protein